MDPVIRENGSIEIPLTREQKAVVDADSYHLVRDRLWYAQWSSKTRSYYAWNGGGGGDRLAMHRAVFGGESWSVDHENHDTLDNRRSNLRAATRLENGKNRRRLSSGTKGVYWCKQHERWRARIAVDGRRFHLGLFGSESEASAAYDAAATRYHGEFAHINGGSGVG